jgi:hypothetical protein
VEKENSNYSTNNELDEQKNIVGYEKQKAIEHWMLNTL